MFVLLTWALVRLATQLARSSAESALQASRVNRRQALSKPLATSTLLKLCFAAVACTFKCGLCPCTQQIVTVDSDQPMLQAWLLHNMHVSGMMPMMTSHASLSLSCTPCTPISTSQPMVYPSSHLYCTYKCALAAWHLHAF